MRDAPGTEQEIKAAQAEMFRRAADEHNLTIAVLARETGIDKDALGRYNHSNIFARARMPLWVFVALCRVIPDNLTSLMLECADKHVGSNEADDGDLDALTTEASGLVTDVLEAKRDGHVNHIEQARIKKRTQKVISIGRRVAAA